MGFLERTEDFMTKVIPDSRKTTLLPEINRNVIPGTTVHTDELMTPEPVGFGLSAPHNQP
jgi:hypothetical protein